jgi:hypothetical protein
MDFYLAITGVPKGESVADFIGLLLIGSFGLWFMGAIMTSKAALHEDGIAIDNWFTRYWIPWSAVSRVDPEPAVTVLLKSGESVGLGVGGGSLINQLMGNRYQHRLTDKIEEVRTKFDPDRQESGTMLRKWRFGGVRLAVWSGLFFGLAALMQSAE